MNKERIINEIKRIAQIDGVPPGQEKFERITSIKRTEWYGKYWARWSDVLAEAGFTPNKFNQAYPKEILLQYYLDLVVELGKLPTTGEIRLKGNTCKDFPSHNVFHDSLGNKHEQLTALLTYANEQNTSQDIVLLITNGISKVPSKTEKATSGTNGYVYLIKFGEFFKIGRSNDFDRRLREIKTKLPEEGDLIHVMETDDPEGIEAYWHSRFKDKRARGEWFKLLNDDVKVFRKRKFM